MNSVYGISAGIDVHKKWLYVVIARPGETEKEFRRGRFGGTTEELARLADWLQAESVATVVMESTARYWVPVWMALEGSFRLLLAQARSNAAARGRKWDYADAARLVKRLWAEDLRLSFVPEPEQRDWRLLTRSRVGYTRDIIRLRNRIEGLLEVGRIKISGLLSDVLGASGRRMLRALAQGETDPQKLASLGDSSLRATKAELARALDGKLTEVHRQLLGQLLEQIEILEDHIRKLERSLIEALCRHADVIRRLCQLPGVGVQAAQQIIAELGPQAASFPSAAQAASWVGVCPGREESAGQSQSDASPKGNRSMRRILNQCAWAAVRSKDTFFADRFRQMVPRLGIKKAVWAIAHRMLRLIWAILHDGLEYQERGPRGDDPDYLRRRLERTLRDLRRRGVNLQVIPAPEANAN
jgi:transposase